MKIAIVHLDQSRKIYIIINIDIIRAYFNTATSSTRPYVTIIGSRDAPKQLITHEARAIFSVFFPSIMLLVSYTCVMQVHRMRRIERDFWRMMYANVRWRREKRQFSGKRKMSVEKSGHLPLYPRDIAIGENIM